MGTVCTVRVLPAGTQTLHQAITHLLNLPLTTMFAIKQNFHLETEAWINKQINMELYASYVYLSMSAYFARTDIALHGFAKRFPMASAEEKDHAEKLISYQILRGGRVTFQALEASLELERTVNESLLAMHKVAAGHEDAQMTDFIEGTFLKEQVEAIKEIGDLITQMKKAGDGLGLHIIDKELQ